MSVAPDRLVGRRAIVTGGSKGIGRAIAEGLTQAGSNVAIWARGTEALETTAAELGVTPVVCDITDRTQVDTAVTATVHALGGIDVLVANAAAPGSNTLFPDTPNDAWDDVIAVNLTGTFNTMRAVAHHMIAAGGGGKMIVVSSIGARFALARAVEYASAKAALGGLVRSVAVAMARHGVQVNAVLPGWVQTDMSADQLQHPDVGPKLVRRTPARRFARPEDLVGICVYLASDLSDFHTGDTITIDGGFTIS